MAALPAGCTSSLQGCLRLLRLPLKQAASPQPSCLQMVAERDAAIRAACLHALEVLYCQEGAPEVRSAQESRADVLPWQAAKVLTDPATPVRLA